MDNMTLIAKWTLEAIKNSDHDCKTSEDHGCLACSDQWELENILARIQAEQARHQKN